MHRSNGPMQPQHLDQSVAVEDVSDLERSPLDGPIMPPREIVIGDRQEARMRKRLACVTSDISCPAGYQHCTANDGLPFCGCPKARVAHRTPVEELTPPFTSYALDIVFTAEIEE
jgi:hypothetical protein